MRSGETKTFEGLPTGLAYEVSEDVAEGYTTTWSSNRTGAIGTADSPVTVTATNTRDTGAASVTKTLPAGTTGVGRSGCVFGLWTTQAAAAAGDQSGETFKGAKTTRADGTTDAWTDLPTGAYWIREISVPNGTRMILNTTPKQVAVTKGATAAVEFENAVESPTGSLAVMKQVAGTGASTTQLFSFRVELGDAAVTGKRGEMTFDDGVATFTVRHGQTVTATGLPAGTSYSVSETPAVEGYTASWSSNRTGTIAEDATVTVAATNTRDVGKARVKKAVSSDAPARANLSGCVFGLWTTKAAAEEGTQGGSAFKGVKASGADGLTGWWEDLPTGTYYAREVSVPDGSRLLLNTAVIPIEVAKSGEATVTCTNQYDQPKGSLSVTKAVTGEGASQSQDFGFTTRKSDAIIPDSVRRELLQTGGTVGSIGLAAAAIASGIGAVESERQSRQR